MSALKRPSAEIKELWEKSYSNYGVFADLLLDSQKKQPLTPNQLHDLWKASVGYISFARMIEQLHGIGEKPNDSDKPV